MNIKSTGFRIQGNTNTVYITDTPNADKQTGVISIVKKGHQSGTNIVVVKSAGTVDYVHGEVNLTTINILLKLINLIILLKYKHSQNQMMLLDYKIYIWNLTSRIAL